MPLASQKRTKAERSNTMNKREKSLSGQVHTYLYILRLQKKKKQMLSVIRSQSREQSTHSAPVPTCILPQTKTNAAPAPQEHAPARMRQHQEIPGDQRVHSTTAWDSSFALRQWTENSLKENLCGEGTTMKEERCIIKLFSSTFFRCFFLQRVRKSGSAAPWKRVNQRERGGDAGSRHRTARREVKLWRVNAD